MRVVEMEWLYWAVGSVGMAVAIAPAAYAARLAGWDFPAAAFAFGVVGGNAAAALAGWQYRRNHPLVNTEKRHVNE